MYELGKAPHGCLRFTCTVRGSTTWTSLIIGPRLIFDSVPPR